MLTPITSQDAAEFLHTGKVLVDFDDGALYDKVMAGFRRFREEERNKELWGFAPDKPKDKDLGFFDRNGEQNQDEKLLEHDHKSVFHYNPELWMYLARTGVDAGPWAEWFDDCHALWMLCFERVIESAAAVDRISPFNFKDSLCDPRLFRKHKLRLNYYPGTSPASRPGMLGKGHEDRDAITIHVAESRPGMRIGGKLYGVEAGKSLVFAGSKAYHRSHGMILPVWHDIENYNDGGERESAVFFSHTDDSAEQVYDAVGNLRKPNPVQRELMPVQPIAIAGRVAV